MEKLGLYTREWSQPADIGEEVINMKGELTLKEIQSIVRVAVNNNDPLKLISLGSPQDEYESEIIQISSKIYKDSSSFKVSKIILEVFNSSFGPEEVKHRKIYDKIADEIITAIKNYNSI